MPEVNQTINGNKMIKNALGGEGTIVSMIAPAQLAHTQVRFSLFSTP